MGACLYEFCIVLVHEFGDFERWAGVLSGDYKSMKEIMKRLFITLLIGLAGALPSGFCQSSGAPTQIQFTIALRGAGGPPSYAGVEIGSGSATLDGNAFSFSFGNISSQFNAFSAGIYGPAPVGSNGPVIFGLLPRHFSPLGRTVFIGAYTLTPAQIAQVKAGFWYVNVNSPQNRNGSLRGQIVPVPAKPQLVTGGFYGQSLLTYQHLDGPPSPPNPPPPPPVVWVPYKAWVSIYGTNGQLVTRIISNPVGQFYSYLKPGDYILLGTPTDRPLPPRNLSQYSAITGSGFPVPEAPTVNVTVAPDQWTPADINFVVYEP